MSFVCQFIISLLFILLISSVISLDLRTGTICKIQCQLTGNFFIGSTTIGIEKAMRLNKNSYECYKRGNYKSNDSIFEVMANKDYNVTILEIINELANDADFLIKLKKRKRFYVEQFYNAVNKYTPLRTKKEWVEVNRDNISQYRKEYYDENREAELQKSKVYYANKSEAILKKRRSYYPRIRAQLLEKVTCEVCGVVCSKVNFLQHTRSKRHLTALAKLN